MAAGLASGAIAFCPSSLHTFARRESDRHAVDAVACACRVWAIEKRMTEVHLADAHRTSVRRISHYVQMHGLILCDAGLADTIQPDATIGNRSVRGTGQCRCYPGGGEYCTVSPQGYSIISNDYLVLFANTSCHFHDRRLDIPFSRPLRFTRRICPRLIGAGEHRIPRSAAFTARP